MTATLHLDELDEVRLAVTVDRAGHIHVQHQDTDDRDLTERELARLAARLDERIHPSSTRVVLPRASRGVTVLPCARCRTMLDADQVVWLTPWTGSNLIREVGCRSCAKAAR